MQDERKANEMESKGEGEHGYERNRAEKRATTRSDAVKQNDTRNEREESKSVRTSTLVLSQR